MLLHLITVFPDDVEEIITFRYVTEQAHLTKSLQVYFVPTSHLLVWSQPGNVFIFFFSIFL